MYLYYLGNSLSSADYVVMYIVGLQYFLWSTVSRLFVFLDIL